MTGNDVEFKTVKEVKLYRIDDLIRELNTIRKSQGHNHIAVDSEIKFLKGYTDGKCFLSEYDFIEIPDSKRERYRPITFLGNLKNVS